MGKMKKFLKVLKDYLWIILGALITAAAINLFLVPYKIAPGGVSGIATVVYYLSGERFPVGVTMLALNIPLFIAGIKMIGRKFIIRTLFATLLLSVVIDVTEPYSEYFTKYIFTMPEELATSSDLLLYAVFGGFLMGAGLGIVFRSGATTGGTDLAARLSSHFFPSFTLGKLLLLIDAGVIIFAAVAFKSFVLALYAIVALFVSSKVIDAIIEGVNFAKAVFIISEKSDDIGKKILSELQRGVTSLKGTGLYTGKDKNVLLCVLHRGQIPAVKRIVADIDGQAFVILTDIREVLGEGFKSYIE